LVGRRQSSTHAYSEWDRSRGGGSNSCGGGTGGSGDAIVATGSVDSTLKLWRMRFEESVCNVLSW
jgi:hypothetical protein